jgi:hypothetical protein
MRQFVDQRDARPAQKNALRIQFLEDRTTIFHLAMREHLEPICLSDRIGTGMRFKVSENHIGTPLRRSPGVGEHLERFSDTGRVAQVDLQFTALFWILHRHQGWRGKTRTSIPSASRIRRRIGSPKIFFRQVW